MTTPAGPLVTTVADGVARLAWMPGENVDVVRRAVAEALTTHHRVEVHLDPADERAQRTAAFSGLQREGVMRGVTVDGRPVDRVVYGRVVTDAPTHEPEAFRAMLNSVLPRKRAIAQMLLRDERDRVLICNLTYKADWDLPGGVVEVNESPALAVGREVKEELALSVPTGALLLTDWLPPWSGWDDAVCLVFDGGVHPRTLVDEIVPQAREIKGYAFSTLEEVDRRCADFTARRIRAALARTRGEGEGYAESGRPLG
ncbi:MAG: NUDIX hydrolase [Nocardioides sp.]|uniref:NUDIX domain-containing protein n=1 Tax=Nocardioides sp. TaxID=35761 RepID=UPI0039E26E11